MASLAFSSQLSDGRSELPNDLPPTLVSLLDSSDVVVPRRVETMEKISRLITGGAENLSVISDFDHTLSLAFSPDGQKVPFSHEVLRGLLDLPDLDSPEIKVKIQSYTKAMAGRSSTSTSTDPFSFLNTWWEKLHQEVINKGLTRQEFEQRMKQTDITLRDGVPELLEKLSEASIPTAVFSAGLADVIVHILGGENKTIPQGVTIIANEMVYEEDKLVSWRKPLLHQFNKTAEAANDSGSPLARFIHSRPHLLVIGDSVSDTKMDQGLAKERENTLRIGFLNGITEKLEEFQKNFDIVLLPPNATCALLLELVVAIRK